jgi:uncharacterized membrane protein YhaH (DUF805 family)
MNINWFLDPITNHYADFSGRATRQQYWMYILYSLLLGIALGIFGLDMIAGLLSLALLIPNIAIGARRLHDIGKSGWWQLIAFIPFVGVIILIVWFATRGEAEANRFGPGAGGVSVPATVPPAPAASSTEPTPPQA